MLKTVALLLARSTFISTDLVCCSAYLKHVAIIVILLSQSGDLDACIIQISIILTLYSEIKFIVLVIIVLF